MIFFFFQERYDGVGDVASKYLSHSRNPPRTSSTKVVIVPAVICKQLFLLKHSEIHKKIRGKKITHSPVLQTLLL